MKTLRFPALATIFENGLSPPPSWFHPPTANKVLSSGFAFFASFTRTYILSSFHSYIASL